MRQAVIGLLILLGGAGAFGAADEGLNVTAFGAVGDGVTDSTTAIQRAIDLASANPTRGRVFLPAGKACYRITEPLRLSASGVRLEGESYAAANESTCVAASGFAGPLIHAAVPGAADLPFTDSLVEGKGRALALSTKTQDSATFLDLEDAAAARLGGLQAFTAELFFRLDANNPNFPTLWASSESLGGTDRTHNAFAFDLDDGLRLTARLTAGDVVRSIRSEPLTLHEVYHAALSYDGTAVRFFIGTPGRPSVLVGTEPASGGVSQGPYELMPIGGRHGPWPHGARYTDVPEATVDSLRLSASARYTQPFEVPTHKLPFDEATLLVENFDRETAEFSIVQAQGGPAYMPKYPPLKGLLGYLEVSHLALNAGLGIGIWLHGVFHSHFHHLAISGGVYGISGREANFLDSFTNLHLDSGEKPFAKAAIALSTNVSITSIRDSSFSNWPTAVAITNSGGGELSNLFVHGKGQILAFLISGSDVHLNSVFCSNEDADAGYQANMRLTANPSVVITGGNFERFINDGPAIQVDGGESITMTGPWFLMHKQAREVVNVVSPPKHRILILNGTVSPEVPWSSAAERVMALP
jgi:hypothetical protein